RLDEQADDASRVGETADDRLEQPLASGNRKAAFGRQLLALLGHQADIRGPDRACEVDHRVRRGHLEVDLARDDADEPPHVVLLDVPPVFAKMHSDAGRTAALGGQRGFDGIRIIDAAHLADGRDVIDVHAEAQRVHQPSAASIAAAMRCAWRSTAPSSSPSTMTRASGSVPENRTTTRPRPPSASSASAIAPTTAGIDSSDRRSRTLRLTSRCGNERSRLRPSESVFPVSFMHVSTDSAVTMPSPVVAWSRQMMW